VGAAALLIAIDRFLSEIRALTSGTANVAASLLVTRWSGVRPALPSPRRGE
jgi:aerobic C4-dicarboxylate transport protein